MARGTGKKGKSGESGQDEEGRALWKAYVRDIVPMQERAGICDEATVKTPRRVKEREESFQAPARRPPLAEAGRQAPQLDARTDQRLRRGRVSIEGTLDLHGMTQQQAHLTLNEYITQAHAHKKRCVLVITGKGKSGEGAGVLKQKFPQWAGMPPLCDIILKIQTAIPRHGGTGAWYVYLKRQREG